MARETSPPRSSSSPRIDADIAWASSALAVRPVPIAQIGS